MKHAVRGTVAAIVFGSWALSAGAVDAPAWPGVTERMRELQQVIASPATTAARREAARQELSGLLRSAAGQSRGPTADEKPPYSPRAAIEPIGPIVKPAVNPRVSVPGVATVEVTIPPRIMVTPSTGIPIAPAGRSAVDPRTGNVLHEAGNGFVDPRTGQFTPK